MKKGNAFDGRAQDVVLKYHRFRCAGCHFCLTFWIFANTIGNLLQISLSISNLQKRRASALCLSSTILLIIIVKCGGRQLHYSIAHHQGCLHTTMIITTNSRIDEQSLHLSLEEIKFINLLFCQALLSYL